MLTIKQIEAFYWVARLGTLSKAAERLHITQSAATKRLQEVEALVASPLFEGSARKNALTAKGSEMVAECEKLFSILDELDTLKNARNLPARIIHVGLTELTALTWFPGFIKEVKEIYPTVNIQPEIDLSHLLRQKVIEGKLDFAFLPDPPLLDGLVRIRMGEVPFGWFVAPGILAPDRTYTLHDLAQYPLVEQSQNSIITELCAPLWESAGVYPERLYGGNNVNALAALIAAGVGISCLPTAIFEQEVGRGRLQLLETDPPAPRVTYYCCFLQHLHSALGYGVADIARGSFNLSQGAPPPSQQQTALSRMPVTKEE